MWTVVTTVEGISSQIIEKQHKKRKRNVTGLCCNRQVTLGLEKVLVYRQTQHRI